MTVIFFFFKASLRAPEMCKIKILFPPFTPKEKIHNGIILFLGQILSLHCERRGGGTTGTLRREKSITAEILQLSTKMNKRVENKGNRNPLF